MSLNQADIKLENGFRLELVIFKGEVKNFKVQKIVEGSNPKIKLNINFTNIKFLHNFLTTL